MGHGQSGAMWSQLLHLSARSGFGLQEQIREMLVSAILEGQLPAGVPVPSSRKLAGDLDVARNTVVLAYQQLVDEGYLVARERSGYFVNPEMLGAKPGADKDRTMSKPAAPHWEERLRFRPSAQRNIVKPLDWQEYPYPFIYGQFDRALFPTQEWRECCMKELGVMEIRDWAPDLIARDDPALIREIQSKVLPRRGVWATADEILVTVGAQHALYLIADLLVSPDTTVGIENPGYPDARNIFAARTQKLVPLGLDGEGIVMSEALRDCDYVFVTPSHQCPTTVTMPLARRQALLALAEEARFVLIEDDYEIERSFGGEPTPALKSLDHNDRVIYVGSLSKSFAPGLRVGYIVGPAELVRELRALRRLMLRHPSAFIQRSFATFLSLGHYDALQKRLAVAYKDRAHALCAAIARHLPDANFVPVAGGASCWVQGPEWLDASELARAAVHHGVLIEPGQVFFASNPPPRNFFRLGFSSIGSDQIERGIRRLGEAMRALATRAEHRRGELRHA